MTPTRASDRISIAQILGAGDDMGRRRYQHPKVLATKAKRPQWYFRARVDVLTDARVTERREQIFYLGFCDKTGKRDAEKARDEILTDLINKPQIMIQSQVRFKDVIAAYKRAHVPTLRAASRKGYLYVIEKYVEPHFSAKRMCDINHEEIQKWVNSIPLSYRSKRSCVLHFASIWKKARLWGYTMLPSPTEGVSLGVKRHVFERRILTAEEFMKLSAALEEPHRLMAQIAVFTGLRISEIRGLAWKYVDAAGCIHIEQRKDSLDTIEPPKTEASRRMVPLGHLLESVLKLKPVNAMDTDLVFPNCGRYEDCVEALHIAAKAVGIDFKGFGWHSFRRMHNTWFRKEGGIALAMQQLGHTDSATNDLYLMVEQEDFRRREEVVRKLQERIMGRPQGGVM